MKFTYPIFTVLFIFFASIANAQIFKKEQIWSGNPVLPGDFADPCILVYKDTVYIYATAANVATVWRSADMVNWKLTKLNWPTSMHQPDVWAPAVTRGVDGKFYLYTSVNHQIYVGVADHPLGPFKNLLGDSALITDRQYWQQMHSIDADCFVNDDGQAYLYWGSGWDFKDGICAVVPLNQDMVSFEAQPKAITPEGYFEGPHMLKHGGKYYLMYSDGVYFNDSYKVRYAIGNKPTGPFVQAENNPILVSDHTKHVSGPGHHFTFKIKDQNYIVYHKHTFPFRNGQRQVCIDRLDFDENGLIKKVFPTDTGVPLNFVKHQYKRIRIQPIAITASAEENKDYVASNAIDNNNGTRWLAPAGKQAHLQVDLGKAKNLSAVELVFDEIMGNYDITYSIDGDNWVHFAAGNNAEAKEWPIECRKQVNARYLKITINSSDAGKQAGLWGLKIYQ